MTPLAWSAITDFILSGEGFFLAGLLFSKAQKRGAARWYAAAVLLFLSLAPFCAAIDHGFIEGRGFMPGINIVTRISWIFIGLSVAAILVTVMLQYFPRQRWLRILSVVQFVAFLAVIFSGDQYILVSANAAPELILGLVVGLIYLRRPGSPELAAGAALFVLGSVIQALGLDLSDALDHNVIYHLLLIVGTFSLYRAGSKFDAQAT